jgi:hypothetical protein
VLPRHSHPVRRHPAPTQGHGGRRSRGTAAGTGSRARRRRQQQAASRRTSARRVRQPTRPRLRDAEGAQSCSPVEAEEAAPDLERCSARFQHNRRARLREPRSDRGDVRRPVSALLAADDAQVGYPDARRIVRAASLDRARRNRTVRQLPCDPARGRHLAVEKKLADAVGLPCAELQVVLSRAVDLRLEAVGEPGHAGRLRTCLMHLGGASTIAA